MKDQTWINSLRHAYRVPIEPRQRLKAAYSVARSVGTDMRQRIGFCSLFAVAWEHTSPLFWLLCAGLCLLVSRLTGAQVGLFIVAPLISVIGFSEWSRSFYHGMWELERTCRLDLRRLLLVKLSLMGAMSTLALLVTNFMIKGAVPPVYNALCTMAMFFLGNLACFFVFDLTRSADRRLPCIAAGILISLAGGIAYGIMGNDLLTDYPTHWLLLLLLSTVLLAIRINKILYKGERI